MGITLMRTGFSVGNRVCVARRLMSPALSLIRFELADGAEAVYKYESNGAGLQPRHDTGKSNQRLGVGVHALAAILSGAWARSDHGCDRRLSTRRQ
jgi:hypothetical protein